MSRRPLSFLAVSDISAGTRIGNISDAYIEDSSTFLILKMEGTESISVELLQRLATWLIVPLDDICVRRHPAGLKIEIVGGNFSTSDDLEDMPDTECCGSGMCKACPSK